MTSKERHTIAIIDDHPLFRRGVRELLDLEQGLDVVGEAGTREEAIKLVRRTEPDLTILDLNMKGCSGVEILSTLKDEDPSRRIVVLTVSDSGKDLTACIQAGADGYFLKDMEPEEFLKSIRRRSRGRPSWMRRCLLSSRPRFARRCPPRLRSDPRSRGARPRCST